MSDEGASERIEHFFRRSRDTLRISGFRKFILRGNVIDLATGVVIGAAFTAVINALVRDFLTPIIGIAVGGHTTCTEPVPPATPVCTTESFADRKFTVNGSIFQWGDFVNNVLSLILIGLALYYFVVLPVNSLMERFKPETEPGKRTKVCPECKSSIPYDATRCAFCTVEQPPFDESQLTTATTT
ncbi:MAG: large conductance mechanosensitive channel [Frankiaceae bacterium]|nr:large conductance mechanosensitive channel [Frankiaceae bacterium]